MSYNFGDMVTANCIDKLSALWANGYYVGKSGKISKNDVGAVIETPWVMHHIDRKIIQCSKWHEMMFKMFKVIPRGCMDCFKVVVRPRSVVELFKLHDLQASMNVPCKAGIEIRAYTPALYGGYFYCRGVEEGQERYEQVRALMDKHFGTDMKVYLKRACTEFELQFGDSDKWELDPLADFYEKWIDTHVDPKVFGTRVESPSFVKLNTKTWWLRFACEHGDETYKEFTDGEEMYTPPVTYHKEREND